MRKSKSGTKLLPVEEQWRGRYKVGCHGSSGECWAIYSLKWHSVRPCKRISPWFEYRSDAESWIKEKWVRHIENKLERALLKD